MCVYVYVCIYMFVVRVCVCMHVHVCVCVGTQNLKSLVVVLSLEVSFSCSFAGMGGLNVTDCQICIRKEKIPLLWSTVRERAFAKCFCFKVALMGNMRYPCVCRRSTCVSAIVDLVLVLLL